MLNAIQDLPENWVLSSSHGNYAALARSKHPTEWSEPKLVEDLSKPLCHLTVERRLQLPQFGGGDQARAMLLESVAAVKARPVWLPEPARAPTIATGATGTETPVADDEALAATEIDCVEDAAGVVDR